MTMSSLPVVYMDACCYIDLVKEAMSQPVIANRKPHVYFCRKFLEAARAAEGCIGRRSSMGGFRGKMRRG